MKLLNQVLIALLIAIILTFISYNTVVGTTEPCKGCVGGSITTSYGFPFSYTKGVLIGVQPEYSSIDDSPLLPSLGNFIIFFSGSLVIVFILNKLISKNK